MAQGSALRVQHQIAAACKPLAENWPLAQSQYAVIAIVFAQPLDIELVFYSHPPLATSTMEAFAALPDFIFP